MATKEPDTVEAHALRAERLEGVGCVITGGASGIGFEVARELARLGGAVGILDLHDEAATSAALRIAKDHSCITAGAAANVTDANAVHAAFHRLALQIGPIGVLINCAGIMTPRMLPMTEMSISEFEEMLDVHVKGTFICSQAALPGMQRQSFGRIVNISSVLGILGLPFRIGYATAKTAIVGFTRSLAVEVARQGVTVNAVAPGYILTSTLQKRVDDNMIDYARLAERAPMGRWGLPEEVARVIGFLSLPGSTFITGAIVPVDGGYTIRGDPDEAIGARPASLDAVRNMFRLRT
ncbi:MAG TPA: SDR family oxidoreductase [Bradyrhizobium sp.]|nr:SDR family oxidoreductase [Bradyrhizobium sp.]